MSVASCILIPIYHIATLLSDLLICVTLLMTTDLMIATILIDPTDFYLDIEQVSPDKWLII